MTNTTYNTNENVKLVNNISFNINEIAGAYEALVDYINGNAEFPEAFEDVLAVKIVTRPSGSKYGILNFA
tara:strand:+ start:67 stop:276 length:210 start_codon:yes stop_codon:yes gene_type:complete